MTYERNGNYHNRGRDSDSVDCRDGGSRMGTSPEEAEDTRAGVSHLSINIWERDEEDR